MIVLDLLIFCVFIFLVLIPHGKLIIKILGIKLEYWDDLLLSTIFGILLITIEGYILGLLNVFYLIRLTAIIPFVYCFISRKEFLDLPKHFKIGYIQVFVLLSAVVIQSLLLFPFANHKETGLSLIGSHGHDTIWHVAVTESILQKIPVENPIFSGELLKNYHLLKNVFVAAAFAVTGINILDLYLRFVGPFFLFLLVSILYIILKNFTENIYFSLGSVIFILFSSNLYYLFTIFFPTANASPSLFWIDEYSTRVTNLQLLFSEVIILSLLYLMLQHRYKDSIKHIVFFGFTVAVMFGFKSYSTVLFLLGLGVLAAVRILSGQLFYGKVFLTASLLTFLHYFITINSSASIFIFSPLWYIKTMFESKDHLNYSDWELRRQTFLTNNNIGGIIRLYLQGLFIFLIGNLGIKVAGLLSVFIKSDTQYKKDVLLMLISMSICGILIPLFFIQRGVVWNSIQFSYYSILFLGLLTALLVYQIYQVHKKACIVFSLLIFLIHIPGVYYTHNSYQVLSSITSVSSNLLDAAEFLKNKSGVILVDPLYTESAVIPAFSGKSVYFADEIVLSILLVDFSGRRETLFKIFNNQFSDEQLKNLCKENNISFILSQKDRKLHYQNLKKVFENEETAIYKI